MKHQVCLWNGSHGKAQIEEAIILPFDEDEAAYGVNAGTEAMYAQAEERGLRPILSVGHVYNGCHDKTAWVSGTVLKLQYHERDKDEVAAYFTRKGIRTQIDPSTALCDGDPCETFLVELYRPIDSQKTYQRLAYVMAADIGIPSLSVGYANVTFLYLKRGEHVDTMQGKGRPLHWANQIDEYEGIYITGDNYLRKGL